MALEAKDVLVALKLQLLPNPKIPFERLEVEIGLSSSTLHRSVKRLSDARLLSKGRKVQRRELLDFLLHGVRYAFYVQPGAMTRGMPTAYGAPPLSRTIFGHTEVPVWPDPDGEVRGVAVEPLDPIAPSAARRDLELYELLALVDAIRIGQARERKIAGQELKDRLLGSPAMELAHD